MKFELLSAGDIEAIDALKQSYGGAQAISQTIRAKRNASSIVDSVTPCSVICTD